MEVDDGHESLGQAFTALVAQFAQGVTAYEELVGAATAYVAEEGRTTPEHRSVSRLAEATDLLRGIAMIVEAELVGDRTFRGVIDLTQSLVGFMNVGDFVARTDFDLAVDAQNGR